MTWAEPAAMVGFLGPRVYEAITGAPFPAGVQTAENLADCGVVDGVCTATELATRVAQLLDVVATAVPARTAAGETDLRHVVGSDNVAAWTAVTTTRHPLRPGMQDVLAAAERVVPVHGTGAGETDGGIAVALARFDGVPCVMVGHDRRCGAVGPGGLRHARRGVRLAQELRLPLVTVIDTAGAELSRRAEEGALAPEIARCIADLLTVAVPTVSVLLGQGSGGAALALFPADRIVAASRGWLSPLPPEGASAILHRTTYRAAEMAAALGIRASDLVSYGAVDRVIPDVCETAADASAFVARVAEAIRGEVIAAAGIPDDVRRDIRSRRFDTIAAIAPAMVETVGVGVPVMQADPV
jgi:acetyl-CoA carboxylase carboxyl transferase subunit beta